MSHPSHRVWSALLFLGATILLARTLNMLAGGALSFLVTWVSVMLVAETVVDLTTIVASLRWWRSGSGEDERFALFAAVGATLLHAIRVLIFVLGRTGPWVDFDVRPEQRALHAVRWTWGEVYFAAVMSVLGVIGVVVIWQIRRRRRSAKP